MMQLPEGEQDEGNAVCPAAKRPKRAPEVAAALASSPPTPPGVQTVFWMGWPSTNWDTCLGFIDVIWI